MKQIPLGSVCEINPRKANGLDPEAQCSFIPMEYVDDYLGAIAQTSVRQISEVEKGYTSFQNDDVLFAKITPCMENGKCAVAKNLVNGIGFGSTEFHVIRAKKDEIIPEWAYYFLRQENVRKEAERNMTGSAGQKRVPSNFIKEIPIPLPPLDEQKRIAAILSKADRLRRLRRYARTLSDGYLQAVFLEMFGDPVSNPREWKIVSLGSQLRHIDSGWSPVCDDEPRANNNQWAILRLSAVTTGKYLSGENKLLPSHLEPRPELEVKKGDVLITRKNTVDLVAACAFVHETPPKLMLPDTIFRFSLKEAHEIEPEYLWGLFSEKLFRKSVQSLASGTAGSMPNISKEKFLNINLPLPPLPLQQKFAQIVQQYERLRGQQRESERQAEQLFQSLLQGAFKREL